MARLLLVGDLRSCLQGGFPTQIAVAILVKTLITSRSEFESPVHLSIWFLKAEFVVSSSVVCPLCLRNHSPAVTLVLEVLFLCGLVVVVDLSALLLLSE